MKRWSQYIKERENLDSIEDDSGFATFSINGEECYIRDIWTDPKYRQLNLASKLADKIVEIAKSKGCKYIIGTVCPTANNSTASLQVLLGYNMTLIKSIDNLIIFRKDI